MTLNRRKFLMGAAILPLSLTTVFGPPVFAANSDLLPSEKLLAAAKDQVGVTTSYDPSYVRLAYPGGDVPLDRGVCVDVVIRAYRTAFQFDFQKAVHTDMSAEFTSYPKIWGLKRPDRNIDHRRVPNLETWLYRSGHELKGQNWQAGDLMTCRLPGNLPHIVIVSEPADRKAILLRVVHNIGRGTREEPILMTGLSGVRHFRFLPA